VIVAGTEADTAGRTVGEDTTSDHAVTHDVAVSRPLSNTGIPLDPDTAAEIPSASWGWSGEARKGFKIAGWVVVLCLLAMLRGNQIGHVEDIYLIAFAAALALILIRDSIRVRRPH
jgi:hypothetical protein